MKLAGCLCLAVLGLGLVWAARIGSREEGLTVHEWGTFTSVAGAAGASDYWQPLVEPPDLPCFVHRKSLWNIKVLPARVRMETPVIYFYTPRAMQVTVDVRFPDGMLTEWYPRATREEQSGKGMEWSGEVLPVERPAFPVENRPSRYYAARETDAAPIRVGSEQEKLIFYRGTGTFAAPLIARFTGPETLALTGPSAEKIPAAIVFVNRGGKIGWRTVRLPGEALAGTNSLSGDLDGLKAELEQTLTSQGLYEKEARAMVETWRDSWFEEGTRVLYIVPRGFVDAVLPLTVNPTPAALARVFVGRVEVLAPWMEREVNEAVATDRPEAVEKYGRFLQAFLRGRKTGPNMNAYVSAQYQQVFSRQRAAGCTP